MIRLFSSSPSPPSLSLMIKYSHKLWLADERKKDFSCVVIILAWKSIGNINRVECQWVNQCFLYSHVKSPALMSNWKRITWQLFIHNYDLHDNFVLTPKFNYINLDIKSQWYVIDERKRWWLNFYSFNRTILSYFKPTAQHELRSPNKRIPIFNKLMMSFIVC